MKNDLMMLGGFALVLVGLWQISSAVAFIFGGGVLALIGWLDHDRRAKEAQAEKAQKERTDK